MHSLLRFSILLLLLDPVSAKFIPQCRDYFGTERLFLARVEACQKGQGHNWRRNILLDHLGHGPATLARILNIIPNGFQTRIFPKGVLYLLLPLLLLQSGRRPLSHAHPLTSAQPSARPFFLSRQNRSSFPFPPHHFRLSHHNRKVSTRFRSSPLNY